MIVYSLSEYDYNLLGIVQSYANSTTNLRAINQSNVALSILTLEGNIFEPIPRSQYIIVWLVLSFEHINNTYVLSDMWIHRD